MLPDSRATLRTILASRGLRLAVAYARAFGVHHPAHFIRLVYGVNAPIRSI